VTMILYSFIMVEWELLRLLNIMAFIIRLMTSQQHIRIRITNFLQYLMMSGNGQTVQIMAVEQ